MATIIITNPAVSTSSCSGHVSVIWRSPDAFDFIHLKKHYGLEVHKDNFLVSLFWNNSDYLTNLDETFLENLEYPAKKKKINSNL